MKKTKVHTNKRSMLESLLLKCLKRLVRSPAFNSITLGPDITTPCRVCVMYVYIHVRSEANWKLKTEKSHLDKW